MRREVKAPLVDGIQEVEQELLREGYELIEVVDSKVKNIWENGNPSYYEVIIVVREMDDYQKRLIKRALEYKRKEIERLRKLIKDLEEKRNKAIFDLINIKEASIPELIKRMQETNP